MDGSSAVLPRSADRKILEKACVGSQRSQTMSKAVATSSSASEALHATLQPLDVTEAARRTVQDGHRTAVADECRRARIQNVVVRNTDREIDALKAAGCHVSIEVASHHPCAEVVVRADR